MFVCLVATGSITFAKKHTTARGQPETLIQKQTPDVFLGKDVLKICNKFTREHPCQKVVSIKLQSNFIDIAFRHGYFLINLLQIFRTTFPRNTSKELLISPSIYFNRFNLKINTFFYKQGF